MDIQLFCSEQIKEKINRVLAKSGINLSDDAKIVLVERGFEIPPEKLAVIFDPIDYMEAIELLNKDCELKQGGPDTITGFSNNRYRLIPIQEIYHIDARGSEIVCDSGKELYYLKNTLQYYEEFLSAQGIIRINKSQLVNLINVKEIIPWFNGRLVVVLKNNQELEVSRFYAKALRKTLNL
ncbi:MAG: LytTR family DNA-binding domain-containing protein [Eubacteriales bacterium]|nr:LytTR family DNA-binding domain-containing protein [Eubacteriales bacterium]